MKNKFLLSFGEKIIVLSLILSSFIIGGTVGAYYLFFNNQQEEEKKIEYFITEKKIYGKNSPILYQAIPKYNGIIEEPWLNKFEENMLIDKIKNELGYGPEFYKLRSITIGDENMTGEDDNGLYIPVLDKIYINLENFKKAINDLKLSPFYDKKTLSQIKVNLIFETIFHEYGHHIAFSYLTNEGNFSNDQDKTIFSNGKLSNWNKNFTNKFKKYLNYSNWKGQKYTSNIQGDKEYRSIGSLYSQEELFNYANQKEKYNFSEMDSPDKIPYLFGPEKKFINIIPLSIKKEQLSYYYSMDELFTRKYQQLNQIYKPVKYNSNTRYNRYTYYILNGYFLTFWINGNIKSVELSDILTNSLLYQKGFGNIVRTLDGYELKNFNDYNKKQTYYQNHKNLNPHFEDSTISNRFLYDAPFNNDKYNYKNNKGDKFKLDDHHIDLYNLMDNFLGHANGSDISIVWPKNSIVPVNNKLFHLEEKNKKDGKNLFKFGGYIKNKDYDSIGYKDSNGDYKVLSKIIVNDFTYKHKDWLGATEHVDLDSSKENYFYTTDIFIDKKELLGKKLWFKKKDGNLEKLKLVREDKDTGTNSTWYTHFSDVLEIDKRYSFVLDKGNVVFKEIK